MRGGQALFSSGAGNNTFGAQPPAPGVSRPPRDQTSLPMDEPHGRTRRGHGSYGLSEEAGHLAWAMEEGSEEECPLRLQERNRDRGSSYWPRQCRSPQVSVDLPSWGGPGPET